jgi:hypothetical protein
MDVPGRYSHNRDPELAELLHQVTLDGWANDSTGDLDQDGFHASLVIVEPAEQHELTDAFDHPIPAGSWLPLEDEHGFVTLKHYPTPLAARQAFTRLQEGGGPGSDDGTGHPTWTARPPRRLIALPAVRPCPCHCNRGGWCGGCGHAGCGRR